MASSVAEAIAAADKRIKELEFDLAVARAAKEFLSVGIMPTPAHIYPTLLSAMGNEEARAGKIPDLARAVLAKAGKPMHIRDIAPAIEAMGAKPTDKTSVQTLAMSALCRSKKFKKMGKGVFGLAEWNKPVTNSP